MANIALELQQILSAIYGEEVRGSIHNAIDKINKVGEKTLNSGTDIEEGDPAGAYYDNSLYINTDTNDLLRCNGTTWIKIGSIKGANGEDGKGIDEITGPVTSGLVDTYTIHYTDGTTSEFTVTNAKSITRITGPVTVGLVDTYTIEFNDGPSNQITVTNGNGIVSFSKTGTSGLIDTYTITFDNGDASTITVTNGINGNKWYRGTAISGKSSNPTKFTGSGIANANVNDFYINISEGAVYHCDTAGDPNNALWAYDFTMTGGGSSGGMDPTVYANSALALGLSNVVDKALTLHNLTATITELNYMSGVTGDVQTQLNGKLANPSSSGTNGQALLTDGAGGVYWGDVASGYIKDVTNGEFTVNSQGVLSLDSTLKANLINSINPALIGTEADITSIQIGNTKYKISGGHTLDTSVATVEGTTSENQHVPSSYTLKKYANSFKYKFVVEFGTEGNSLGRPIDDKTTWSSATETAAGWIFAEDTQAVRDLFIGLDANESANLDWRFDPVSQDKGLAVVRWQFDTATGMMCFVFNRKCSVGTKFSIDLELLRDFDDDLI